MSFSYRSAIGTLLVVSVVFAADEVFADVGNLLDRVPGDANVIVVIDVQRVMKCPMAHREGWAEKRAATCYERPLIVPPDATRVVQAALLDPSTLRSIWEVSVMEMVKGPNLAAIARNESGYVDNLGDIPAVWSPINAYFIQLDRNVLGAVCPANRQFASRWAHQRQTSSGATMPSYLRSAALGADGGPEFIMAMDLEDVTSPERLKRRMAAGALASLEGKSDQADAICKALASIKGLTHSIEMSGDAKGKCSIAFARNVSAL